GLLLPVVAGAQPRAELSDGEPRLAAGERRHAAAVLVVGDWQKETGSHALESPSESAGVARARERLRSPLTHQPGGRVGEVLDRGPYLGSKGGGTTGEHRIGQIEPFNLALPPSDGAQDRGGERRQGGGVLPQRRGEGAEVFSSPEAPGE